MVLSLVTTSLLENPSLFQAPFRVQADGGYIQAEMCHAAPIYEDIDGDGVKELLGGDLFYFQFDRRTEAQKTKLASLEEELAILQRRIGEMETEFALKALANSGLTPETRRGASREQLIKYGESLDRSQKQSAEYQAAYPRQNELFGAIRQLQPDAWRYGYVWVYLRH